MSLKNVDFKCKFLGLHQFNDYLICIFFNNLHLLTVAELQQLLINVSVS